MKIQYLKDHQNRVLAKVIEVRKGSFEMLDYNTNKVLGYYNEKTNMTHDYMRRFVGFGNLLSSLLILIKI